MIRQQPEEQMRYGKVSEASEFIYDRPFQWGSKRTGPDLQRVGGKYPDSWHYRHMYDPREVSMGSIMPDYKWLFKRKAQLDILPKKLSALKALGVPYDESTITNAAQLAAAQAEEITKGMASAGVELKMKDKQIIALIAYLQRLGKQVNKEGENDASNVE